MIISIRKMESVLKCVLLSVLFLGFTNIFSTAAGNSEVLYTGKQVVVEGESFTITCVTDLFQNIKWQKDLRPIVGDLAKQFNITLHQDKFEIISTLSTSHAQTSHSGSYRCGPFLESYHIYVLSANSITVNYDPDSTRYKTIDFKSPLEIQCNTTESDTRMEWYKNDTKLTSTSRIKIEDNRLIIEKPEVEDAGNYTCKLIHTKGPGNGTVSSSKDIRVVVKPQVGTQKDVTVVEGEKLKLECAVIGSPTPNIVWKFGNNTYNQSTERVQLVEYGGVLNAALIINEATMDDRGNYVCSASIDNDLDISTSTIYVRVKDKLAALWPFLGICAEVFVLCAIILIYEKKRNKTELEESDTDNSPETKNTPDHGKDSVRQRK